MSTWYILTSDGCAGGFDVDAALARPQASCGPPADTDTGYLTPVDADGDEGAVGGVEALADTANSSSMRSKSSLNSLNIRSLVVQTLLRPRTRLAGIFDHATRRNLGRGGGGWVLGAVDGCLTGGTWKPGLHGVARNAGSGGGTKITLGVDVPWSAGGGVGADDDDDDDDDVDGTFIMSSVLSDKCCFQAIDGRSNHSVANLYTSKRLSGTP